MGKFSNNWATFTSTSNHTIKGLKFQLLLRLKERFKNKDNYLDITFFRVKRLRKRIKEELGRFGYTCKASNVSRNLTAVCFGLPSNI